MTMSMCKSNNQSFVAIAAHFIYNKTLHAFLLGVEEFHAQNIAICLLTIFSHWTIKDKVYAAVTNNASKMKNAVITILKKEIFFMFNSYEDLKTCFKKVLRNCDLL